MQAAGVTVPTRRIQSKNTPCQQFIKGFGTSALQSCACLLQPRTKRVKQDICIASTARRVHTVSITLGCAEDLCYPPLNTSAHRVVFFKVYLSFMHLFILLYIYLLALPSGEVALSFRTTLNLEKLKYSTSLKRNK